MSPVRQRVLCEGRYGVRPLSFPVRRRHFMGCLPHQSHTRKNCVFGAFLLPAFLWKGRPEGSPLGGQRKAGAAPHRDNTNKPISNQGKGKKPEKKIQISSRKTKNLKPRPATAPRQRQHYDQRTLHQSSKDWAAPDQATLGHHRLQAAQASTSNNAHAPCCKPRQ